MKLFFLIVSAFFCSNTIISAQNPVRQPRHSFDSTLLSDNNVLTSSDYLESLEKTFQTFNKVPVITASFSSISSITNHLTDDDAALAIIKERLQPNERTLNLRNLQMFAVLLDQLNTDTREYGRKLDTYDSKLAAVKKEILDRRKDTIIRFIFKDSALRASFKPQLQQLRTKWKNADSLLGLSTTTINGLKARVSANAINVQELQYQADIQLKAVGPKAFSKERKYIWEHGSVRKNTSFGTGFKKSMRGEKDIARYYFADTRNQRFLLFVTGLIFFFWIFYNYRSLKRLNKLQAVDQFRFGFIHPVPVVASLIFMLNLAPLFDLNAPAIYLEAIGFLLMLTLTIYLWKRLPHNIFYFWSFFVLLFLFFTFSRLLGLPVSLQRYWTLIINSAAAALGIVVIMKCRKEWRTNRIVGLSICLFILFNILAVLCNIFGRLTLAQIFGATSFYTFVQTIALILFVKMVREAFLLQIQASRIRQQYPEHFEYENIIKGVSRLITIIACIVWFVVLTTNLNIYMAFTDSLTEFLTTQRTIGSFPFKLSGLLLFLGIIWTANFLQRYIAFFLGDTGDEAAFDNKGQRSKLLVTRLVLLIAGFLVAVAASGLPIDKITVILGALGVGIGLGLQSIVNNFVSGIILIFDRPLRIGDVVEIGDKKGRVKEIGVRSSTLLTAEGAEVIIPNGDVLSHNIVNWTLSNNHIRMEVVFKIEKPFDAEAARLIIKESMKNINNVLPGREPEIFINNASQTIADVKVYFWCKDVTKTEFTQSNVYDAVQQQLAAKGMHTL